MTNNDEGSKLEEMGEPLIELTAPDGTPLSVVSLKPGDTVLCRLDQAGRHFGMRIQEEIREV